MMPAIRSILLVMICCSGMYAFPSDSLLLPEKIKNPYNISLTARLGYGFIIPHHPDMRPYTRRHFNTCEFTVSHQTDGRKNWHGVYKYPQTGISFFYSDLTDLHILGSVTAIYPYVNYPLAYGKKLTLNIRVGLGAGYFSTHFDTLKNWKNLAIGSQINGTADVFINMRLKVYKNIIFDAGVGFMHFSNGASFSPNYGINIPTVRAGLSTLVIGKNFKTIPPDKRLKIAKPEISLSLGMGFKDDELGKGPGEHVYIGSFNLHYPMGKKSRITLGIDADYNHLSSLMLEKFNVPYSKEEDLIRYWLHLGAELTMPSISLFARTGQYIKALDQFDGKFPQLIGVRYYFVRKVYLEVALKTHYGKADYLAAAFGYSIFKAR